MTPDTALRLAETCTSDQDVADVILNAYADGYDDAREDVEAAEDAENEEAATSRHFYRSEDISLRIAGIPIETLDGAEVEYDWADDLAFHTSHDWLNADDLRKQIASDLRIAFQKGKDASRTLPPIQVTISQPHWVVIPVPVEVHNHVTINVSDVSGEG